MNKVMLTGRLTKDPDVGYYSANGEQKCTARFTLAVDRRGKKQEGEQSADFIGCVAFGKTGEFVEKYARKGMKFDLAGHIVTGSYDAKDGHKVYTTDVVVDEIEFGESKNASAGQSQDNAPQTQREGAQTPVDEWMNVPDDEEIPFN